MQPKRATPYLMGRVAPIILFVVSKMGFGRLLKPLLVSGVRFINFKVAVLIPEKQPLTPRQDETPQQSIPPQKEDILSHATLPHAPAEKRSEPPSQESPPPPPRASTPPPDVNAMLGRAHITAATGIGCSLAYIGVAAGGGEMLPGILGLAAFCIAQGRFMIGIEERCTTKVVNDNGSVVLPESYMRGTMSVFYPNIILGLLGYTYPETYATPALLSMLGGTALFGGLHALGLRVPSKS